MRGNSSGICAKRHSKGGFFHSEKEILISRSSVSLYSSPVSLTQTIKYNIHCFPILRSPDSNSSSFHWGRPRDQIRPVTQQVGQCLCHRCPGFFWYYHHSSRWVSSPFPPALNLKYCQIGKLAVFLENNSSMSVCQRAACMLRLGQETSEIFKKLKSFRYCKKRLHVAAHVMIFSYLEEVGVVVLWKPSARPLDYISTKKTKNFWRHGHSPTIVFS